MELKIKNEDIVQLRQNDLNRGRNKSNAPVYPKTVPEAIIGLSSYLGKEGLKDVIVVSELPNTGEEGKIYYNQYDYNYYTYNGEFSKIGKETADVVTDIDDVPKKPSRPGVTVPNNSYALKANVFYNIDNWNRDTDTENNAYMKFVLGLDGKEGIFAGRFTAWADDMNITWPAGVTTPDSVDTTIVNGHTYEFNVWQGVLILADVTTTVTTNTATEGGE